MKRRGIRTACALLAAVFAAAFTAARAASPRETAYRIAEYEGRLAVFDPDSGRMRSVTAVYVDTLPRADREALADGISVRGERELAELLEDLGS